MLILLFCELLYFMIRNLFVNRLRSAKISAVFAIISSLNLPIIKFSVYIWATLHQKSSVFTLSGSKIHESMLSPLIIMFFAILFIAKLMTLIYVKLEVVSRKNIGLEVC